MLEYCKKILKAMSFDISLFQKELRKSYGYLNSLDKRFLNIWVNYNYEKLVPLALTAKN